MRPYRRTTKLLGLQPVTAAAAVSVFTSFALPNVHAITLAMMTVGNLGNANDTTGYGDVACEYQIGKYDMTIGQYAEFLNAVAATDTYSPYNARMGTNRDVAGISQTGPSGSHTYRVINSGGDSSNRPIT